jgi:DNA modification methylase
MGDLMSMFMDAENRVEVRRQDALALLRSLDAGSVDLVLTDPPYGISYQSNRTEKGSAAIEADWNFQFGPFLREVERVLVEGGAAYIFTRWDVFPLWHQSVNGVREMAAKNLIVWEKDNHSAGDLKGNFGFKWEGIMMLVKGRHRLRGHRHTNIWSPSPTKATAAPCREACCFAPASHRGVHRQGCLGGGPVLRVGVYGGGGGDVGSQSLDRGRG